MSLRRRTPWRENIEAAVGAVLLAVLFKYFLLEFYKIPSGSMQPTLYGTGAPLELYDRVVADKLSFHFREPERFEVVIFRYPLERSKNFVKRLVGLPGEQLRLENGDLWVRANEDEPWRIPRRPAGVMAEQWRRLSVDHDATRPRWRVQGLAGRTAPDWSMTADGVQARGDGVLAYAAHGEGSLFDDYTDGYPPAVAAALTVPWQARRNAVGDLRVSGELRALEGCTAVTFEIEEGDLLHRLTLPGPAAEPDARPRLESVPRPGRRTGELRGASADEALHLVAGRTVHFEAENLDDRLTLRLDGRELVALDVEPVATQDSAVRIEVLGAGADLAGLELARDVYYAGGRGGSAWTIPPGHYFMLGDNTQDSSDSRDWMRATLAWQAADEAVRTASGNWRPQQAGDPIQSDTNPVRLADGPQGGLTFLRDEWGERHAFESARELAPSSASAVDAAPFVPRELITGRALATLWPISPRLGLWRPKWIR